MSAITWAEIEPTHGLHPRPAPSSRHLRLVPTAPARAADGLVLTRRGRLVLTVLALAIIVATALGAFSSPTSAAIATTGPTITVTAGQTLSEIAAHQYPTMPIADGVAALQIANNLSSTEVNAGQQLVVPAL